MFTSLSLLLRVHLISWFWLCHSIYLLLLAAPHTSVLNHILFDDSVVSHWHGYMDAIYFPFIDSIISQWHSNTLLMIIVVCTPWSINCCYISNHSVSPILIILALQTRWEPIQWLATVTVVQLGVWWPSSSITGGYYGGCRGGCHSGDVLNSENFARSHTDQEPTIIFRKSAMYWITHKIGETPL